MRIDVDLGDGKALPMEVAMAEEMTMENEYVASKRFIDANYEALNANWLEEIARKIRGLVEPQLEKSVESSRGYRFCDSLCVCRASICG